MAVTRALMVYLEAKHGMEGAVEDLLRSAVPLVARSPATTAWCALRFGRGEYGIFDAFRDDAGREARLSSALAAALIGQADALLAQAPRIRKIDVLADKRPLAALPAQDAKALLLTFAARPGHDEELEQFLRDARSFVLDEAKTTAWFALRLDNAEYGIVDLFPDNGARFAHLTGHVPRELAKRALSLLGSFPDLRLLDVVAEHFNIAS